MATDPSPQLDMKQAQATLKSVFGYDAFRPLQADIIEQVLRKQDALVIMPTGSGKSLCYQLPALLFSGLTVVVSPLISLMQDQVQQMQALGVTAVTLNSTIIPEEYGLITRQLLSGQAKLLYVAPETLMQTHTQQLLEKCQVDCFTIDEAHCISEWGHDFRPEYRQLARVREKFTEAVSIAVTATATERVRQDIQTSLGLSDSNTFVASFNRPNLQLTVEGKNDALTQTIQFLAEHKEQSGIIYCATRKQVDSVNGTLVANGYNSLPYHAGLAEHVRANNQRRFIRDDVPIMVATIAFGMGINKSNVRFVVHYDLPKNLESYYQQIGRAGRDGLQADCLLLFSYSDVRTIQYFISEQHESQQFGAQMRLKGMLSFAETAVCRRKPLLEYFGEAYEKESCDMCDNCLSDAQDVADLTVPAQKFLSCVKRTGELFGTNHVIDVLRGSSNRKVIDNSHHLLSTYDIGKEFSKKEWQFLARQFIQGGLLTQDMSFGSLKLTAKAYEVFKGEAFYGRLPEAPTPKYSKPADAPDHDAVLFNLLRAKRKALADEANVPPYVVFSDASLVEMAAYFPQNQESFSKIYGVGEQKLAKYAHDFLMVIRPYCKENNIEEKPKKGGTVSRPKAIGVGSRTDEIITLFNGGQSIRDLMAQFGVKQSTIVNHLWKGVLAKRPLRPNSILQESQLSTEQQQAVISAFETHGLTHLRPIFDTFDERINYDELHLIRLHLAAQANNENETVG